MQLISQTKNNAAMAKEKLYQMINLLNLRSQ